MDASTTSRPRRAARSLPAALRTFLTPALWKHAHRAGPAGRRRHPSRWSVQPLVLTLLALTWCGGDSTAERFETAKAFCGACVPKRRRPGRTVQGFQKALARLPLPVLRAVAAGVRQRLLSLLARHWQVEGFVPLGCDGTRLACPRSAELEQRLGQAGKAGSAPMLWLTALVHLRLGVPWAWQWGKGTASERGHLQRLLPLLPAAALVVADAGFVGYELTKSLMDSSIHFLIRMSSQATLYTAERVPLRNFQEGEVYYGPAAKHKGSASLPLLRLRLIRLRGKKKRTDVWLLTNVLDPQRLPRATAGQFYRWRWESEGLFRTYKRTLAKMKLVSRTVRLVHREAEGSLLATQLLLAQGALAMPRLRGQREPAVASARKLLLIVRQELAALCWRGRRPSLAKRLVTAQRERRLRHSAKVNRVWPQRKPHKPPKPPGILMLTKRQKAQIARGKIKTQ
jgi:hypothetical protein